MDRVSRSTTLHEPADRGNADLRFWLSRPASERIAAVEELRRAHAASADAQPRLQRVVELLAAHAVEFMVVGGYALAAHGRPRYTGDLDLWIDNSAPNVDRLLAVLADFGFSTLGLCAADFAPDDAVVQLGYPPGRIDLITGIDGVRFSDAYPRRQIVHVAGVDLPILHLDDFRVNKRASGRPQDLADLAALDDGPTS